MMDVRTTRSNALDTPVEKISYVVKCQSINRHSALDGKVYESAYFGFPYATDNGPKISLPWEMPYTPDPSGNFSLENQEPGRFEVGKVYEFTVALLGADGTEES